ncbi:hypothetical protein D3C75_1111260 [compost metagenome]
MVLVIGDHKLQITDRFVPVPVRKQVVNQVSTGADSREQTNQSGIIQRVIPCFLQYLPGALHKKPMLRIGDFGFPAGQLEEGCIKFLSVLQ